jgi:hypothetical protein
MDTVSNRIETGMKIWPDAGREVLEEIAAQAEALAEETQRQGREEGWAYGACQTVYGCDWDWREYEDEPTARVFDCDGTTLDTIKG